jgi:hypothetical protein
VRTAGSCARPCSISGDIAVAEKEVEVCAACAGDTAIRLAANATKDKRIEAILVLVFPIVVLSRSMIFIRVETRKRKDQTY